jgi:hypothetical protein
MFRQYSYKMGPLQSKPSSEGCPALVSCPALVPCSARETCPTCPTTCPMTPTPEMFNGRWNVNGQSVFVHSTGALTVGGQNFQLVARPPRAAGGVHSVVAIMRVESSAGAMTEVAHMDVSPQRSDIICPEGYPRGRILAARFREERLGTRATQNIYGSWYREPLLARQ